MTPLREVGLVFVSIQLIIWCGELLKISPFLIVIIPLTLVINYWRKNTQNFKLSFCPMGTKSDYLMMAIVFALFWQIIALIGGYWNPKFFAIHQLLPKMLKSVAFYFPWSFFQQLILNGYFYNRLRDGTSQKNAILISGILFSLTHLPNPVLLITTLIGGWLSAYFFKRTTNLYALAFAHAILAVSIMHFLPGDWHHHLRIGPGYFHWTP